MDTFLPLKVSRNLKCPIRARVLAVLHYTGIEDALNSFIALSFIYMCCIYWLQIIFWCNSNTPMMDLNPSDTSFDCVCGMKAGVVLIQ